VLAALVLERRAVPALPTIDEHEPGDARHQIELRGPHVAERHRERPPRTVLEVVVVRRGSLRGEVVLVEAEVGRVRGERPHPFAGMESPQVRDHDLDDEVAARREMMRRILEAGDLRVLCHQVHDRVEHQIDEREPTGDARGAHVADRDVERVATWLRPQLPDHRVRELDPHDVHTARCERQRDKHGGDEETHDAECSALTGWHPRNVPRRSACRRR